MIPARVSLVELKAWATGCTSTALQHVLVREPDEVGAEDFLAKAITWIHLAEAEAGSEGRLQGRRPAKR